MVPPGGREPAASMSVIHYLWLFFLILSACHCGTAIITMTSNVDGRQAACPGEVVTYTCSVTQAASITWSAPPVLADDAGVVFVPTSERELRCGNGTLQCDDLDYQANLTSVGTVDMAGIATNMTSTFMFTATFELSARGTVVKCSALTEANAPPESQALNVAGLPSPPRTLSYTVEQYGQDSVMLTVQWQSPQDGGGAPVNYTITVSPGSTEVTTGTSFSFSAIPYNVMHNVSIVATNCNGSSSALMETIRIVNCSDPTVPRNGSIEPYQNTTEGAEIFFRCNSQFVPNTTRMATCRADGRWNPDPATLTCTFDCGPPPVPQSGSLESYTDTTEGSVVFYSCDPGLIPEGRMRAVCTRSGWSPNPGALSCSVVNCGMPTGPQNGSIEPYQSTLGGAEIFFMCAPGFVPSGRMRVNCESDGITVNGTWTPDPAALVCNASGVDCGYPNTASSEVIVQYNTTAVSSVIFYQCQQSGFAPSSSNATCMESGRWSPDPSQVVCTTTTPTTGTGGLGTAGTAAIVVVILLLIAVLVVAMVVVGVIWWRKRSSPPPKPPPQSDDVAMYSVVDDSPVKPPPYKGYMLKGPEAEYSTVDDATSPSTSNCNAAEAQYDLPPGSNHPEGLVYAEVNVKPKPSTKRAPRPAKTDDMVEYAAIAYQPKDAAEKTPAVVEPTSKRMTLPDNPDDSVNLDNLLIQLKQVNSMWRELGDALGLPPSILDDISGQFQSDAQQCMVEMLDSWLMRHMHQGSPTWWEVAQALRQIDRKDMADALETVYSTGVLPITVNIDEISEGSLPTDTGSPPPIPVRGPLTDEPDYPPPKPPRSTPEKKAAPPRPLRGGSERKPKPELGVPPRPPRAN